MTYQFRPHGLASLAAYEGTCKALVLATADASLSGAWTWRVLPFAGLTPGERVTLTESGTTGLALDRTRLGALLRPAQTHGATLDVLRALFGE